MRRLYFFILLVAACTGTHYGQNNARLVALDGTLFRVKLKDGFVNTTAQSSVLIENIKVDTLRISLELEDHTVTDIPIYLLEKGKKCSGREFNYKVESSEKPVKLVFSGLYDIKPLPVPLVPTKPVVDTMPAYRNRFLGHLCELKNGNPVYFNNIPKNGKCETKMPDLYLDFVKLLMQKAQVDQDRYDIVENVCRNNCVSVAQFTVLLNYIGFEIEKLKLIKTTYSNFTDPENAKLIESSFRFEASREELKKFLKHPNENHLPSGSYCQTPSDSLEFNTLRMALEPFTSDAERYQAFKKTYTSYCYSINQVKSVIRLFIHDREKTDVATALYYYCTEKENYEKLLELFSYNESKNTLRNFVEKQSK